MDSRCLNRFQTSSVSSAMSSTMVVAIFFTALLSCFGNVLCEGYVPSARVITRDFTEYPLIPQEPNPDNLRDRARLPPEEFPKITVRNETERTKRDALLHFRSRPLTYHNYDGFLKWFFENFGDSRFDNHGKPSMYYQPPYRGNNMRNVPVPDNDMRRFVPTSLQPPIADKITNFRDNTSFLSKNNGTDDGTSGNLTAIRRNVDSESNKIETTTEIDHDDKDICEDYFTEDTTPVSKEDSKIWKPSYSPGSTLGQIIPPGKPWPDSASGYVDFTTRLPLIHHPLPGSFIDRFPDFFPPLTTTTLAPSTTRQTTTPISLEYKPSRPFYHPNPGPIIGQIIPPGKPWPDSPAGYPDFSVTSSPRSRITVPSSITNLQSTTPSTSTSSKVSQRVTSSTSQGSSSVTSQSSSSSTTPQTSSSSKTPQNITSSPATPPSTTPQNTPPTTTKLYTSSLVHVPEPNPLQYRRRPRPPYGPTTASTPFTSGPRKTTLSDIADIVMEYQSSGLGKANASHLLPFDVDNKNFHMPRHLPLKQAPEVERIPMSSGYSRGTNRDLKNSKLFGSRTY